MSDFTGLGDLVDQIKQVTDDIKVADSSFGKRLSDAEKCISDLYRKTHRPSGFSADPSATDERKSATEMCCIKHALDVPKIETTEYVPSSAQIDAALAAKRGLSALIRHGDMNKLDSMERKSLSAFSFGTNQFLLPPQMASQALSCLVYPTDLSGLVSRVQISAGSIKFLIDNARMAVGAWACENSCFANNPTPDLQEGLGELEIKAETIRMAYARLPICWKMRVSTFRLGLSIKFPLA
jgi:hypothetical protein